jgi:hypothetical protein
MTTIEPRGPAPASDYYYRRQLSLRDQLPAIGVALGAAAAAFYVARLLIQRTPLDRVPDIPTVRARGTTARRHARRPDGG